MGNTGSGGPIIAVGIIGIFMILAAIFLPVPTEWKQFFGTAGMSVILFLVAGALWQGAVLLSVIVFLLALGASGSAVYLFQKAADIPVM